jgi:hypothetical protein
MERSIFLACQIFLILLAVAGMPVHASPAVTDIRPVSAPNNGDVSVTITGTGFTSQSTVWLSSCTTGDVIHGTVVSDQSVTCIFSFTGQTPARYNLGVNSPFTDPLGLYHPQDGATLSNAFETYLGNGPTLSYTPLPVITSYGPAGPYGTIYVESSPAGAVISLDGENKGLAPVTITGLWPGSYNISAMLAGYQEYTTITTISGPTRSSVYCPLVPDTSGKGLYVLSTPLQADVYLDGVLAGATPFMQTDPASGTHSIRVRLSGYDDWESTVEINQNGSKTLSAILIRNESVSTQGICVSSDPAGATIILDGRAKGFTPNTVNNIAAGVHVLEVDYPGYVSWKSTIDVPETGFKDIPVNLTPKTSPPGWIAVSSHPGNASVTLDGDYVGRTPVNSTLNLDTVPPGEHVIALELFGYQPYSTRTNVSSRLVSSVTAELIPGSGTFARGNVSVTSDPAGAAIFVDNRSVGISPLTAGDIAAGNHQITLTREGFQDYSTSILVTAGNTSTVSVTLLEVPASLKTPLFPLTAVCALGIVGCIAFRKK